MRNIMFAVILALPSLALAQKGGDKPPAPKPMGTPSEELAMMIQFEGRQLLDCAEDKQFPEAKLDYKPTPEVRSFAEVLLHAAKANMMFNDMALGKKPDFADLKRSDYKTKADIAKVLKQSIDDLTATVKKLGDAGLKKPVKMPFGPPQMVSTQFLLTIPGGHMSEHYGQLVVYYRLNKLVPPSSRPHDEHAAEHAQK